ncbi:MAG: threonylcarbamoyl-AMP synthase [Propionibacteriaceae bacterium]|nr:threonylcarbamoyl-AMP synthase [Propionibacteriaceae bacterium]
MDALNQPHEAMQAALKAIRAGECIVMPTDTVYGIAADPFRADAVQRLLDAKQRGRDMPPPVLIADAGAMSALVEEVTVDAKALAQAYWPGALTLVMNASPALRMELGDRGHTIAVRVPDHGFACDLLRLTGPLAVSSANVSGQPAATDVEQAEAMLGESVCVYLDCGPTSSLQSSTIVDLTGPARILREGILSRADIAEVVDLAAE